MRVGQYSEIRKSIIYLFDSNSPKHLKTPDLNEFDNFQNNPLSPKQSQVFQPLYNSTVEALVRGTGFFTPVSGYPGTFEKFVHNSSSFLMHLSHFEIECIVFRYRKKPDFTRNDRLSRFFRRIEEEKFQNFGHWP